MSKLQTTRTALRTTALLPFTPFIGLAFIVALPVAGLAMLAWFGARALARQTRLLATVRNVALFVAAPFVGLVYVLLMPVVGIATLAWIAGKALTRHAEPALQMPARLAI